jgi:hypothetical protein
MVEEFKQLGAAVISAFGAIIVVMIAAFGAYLTERRQRRQNLYGEAYRAALAWQEMLYRVRRRAAGQESDRALINRFHELQEKINYHQGWIATESVWLGRSYAKLVDAINRKTAGLIHEAWKSPVRDSTNGTLNTDQHPTIDNDCRRFLFDVRCSLSLWQWPKLFVIVRNIYWTRREK